MEQEEIYPEENQIPEQEFNPEFDSVTVAPPLEGAFSKYMREYRLLNSLLISLFMMTILMASIWGMMMGIALGGEGSSDFSDGGAPPAAQKQEKQKVVKLMQRQKKAQPTTQQTFRTTAISDITLPDFNELDVKDLAPVVEAAAPTMGDAGAMNNDKMKKAMAGIGLSLLKTMQQRCDPQKRIARLKSGGGKTMTEAAIVKGLKWLQTMQDPDGSWGGKDKDADGNPKSTDKNAMTGMALLCYLGHCELQDSPDYGPTVQKAINFITSTTPEPTINGGAGSYSHPIRAYALCEAYTMTKIKKLEEFARRATLHIIKGQNENGGWAYGFGKGIAAHTDLSVTGWNIQALKAAAYTGIEISGLDEAMDKAIKYVIECQDDQGRFAYQRGKGGKASLTGAGVLCLQIWKNAKSEEAKKGLEWIAQNQAIIKEWSKVDVYGWYYNAQACFQATGVSGGSKFWKAWNKDFQQTVCSNQAPDGHWPHGNHFHGDTDIYRTTMAILMLEVYYRYMPTTKV
ncbi:terpene cyclase/mutase family protein [Opitutales bacterium]|nr:terpene cyclase/mutase family protein [Opitutales bacterium]